MGSTNLRKKIQLNKTTTSILLSVAIIIVGGLIFKVIADRQSKELIINNNCKLEIEASHVNHAFE